MTNTRDKERPYIPLSKLRAMRKWAMHSWATNCSGDADSIWRNSVEGEVSRLIIADLRAQLAETQAALDAMQGERWKPIPDGDYECQHRGHVVRVDGEWLTIIDANLNGPEIEAELALTDDIRLCQRVANDEGEGQ